MLNLLLVVQELLSMNTLPLIFNSLSMLIIQAKAERTYIQEWTFMQLICIDLLILWKHGTEVNAMLTFFFRKKNKNVSQGM